MYAVKSDSLYVNLFINSESHFNVNENELILKQTTQYPWDGLVNIEIEPENQQEFTLLIRIPGWVGNGPCSRRTLPLYLNPKLFS
ncbi:MAG: hypothetical protein HC906_09630, partial [Bacteroidales bacterium]|nr:hypothetical protein [Bacteroidales bacterium]